MPHICTSVFAPEQALAQASALTEIFNTTDPPTLTRTHMLGSSTLVSFFSRLACSWRLRAATFNARLNLKEAAANIGCPRRRIAVTVDL